MVSSYKHESVNVNFKFNMPFYHFHFLRCSLKGGGGLQVVTSGQPRQRLRSSASFITSPSEVDFHFNPLQYCYSNPYIWDYSTTFKHFILKSPIDRATVFITIFYFCFCFFVSLWFVFIDVVDFSILFNFMLFDNQKNE